MYNLDIITSSDTLTMSTREIAKLLNRPHSDIKRSAERLLESGVLTAPLSGLNFEHRGNTYIEYQLNKRDSLVLVAQNCPAFMAAVIDRWSELELAAVSKSSVIGNVDNMINNAVTDFRANLIKSVQSAINNALIPTMSDEAKQAIHDQELKDLAHSLYFDGNQPHNVQPVKSKSGIPTIMPRSGGAWRLRNYKLIGRVRDWSLIDSQKKGDLLEATKKLIALEIKAGIRAQ